ncbi:MAG: hypothetical protein OEV64_12390 [Desulfobulbaceae bacterium]|nr:hypothetical protein [Desulfobulbaceae bacterium]
MNNSVRSIINDKRYKSIWQFGIVVALFGSVLRILWILYVNTPSKIDKLLLKTNGVVSWNMYHYDGGYVGTVELKNKGRIWFTSMTEEWFTGEADYINLKGFGDYSVRSIVCTVANSELPQLLGTQSSGIPFGKKGNDRVLGHKLSTFQEVVDSYDEILTVLKEWPKSPTDKPIFDLPSDYPGEFRRFFVLPTGTSFDGRALDHSVCSVQNKREIGTGEL